MAIQSIHSKPQAIDLRVVHPDIPPLPQLPITDRGAQ
jgi:hypothetical protein